MGSKTLGLARKGQYFSPGSHFPVCHLELPIDLAVVSTGICVLLLLLQQRSSVGYAHHLQSLQNLGMSSNVTIYREAHTLGVQGDMPPSARSLGFN